MKLHELNFWSFIQTITKLHGEQDINEIGGSDSEAESVYETPFNLEALSARRTTHRAREGSLASRHPETKKENEFASSSDDSDSDKERLT
jgi:hypothetical protein